MNKQDKNIEVFSRIANYVVKQHTSRGKGNASFEYLQDLINNAQIINQTLMTSAIRMVNKAKKSQDATDVDSLVEKLKHIIHSSVTKYTQSYS
ncbi:MAG: hypothetical protein R2800_08760 [Flavipsychrobacter sp.]